MSDDKTGKRLATFKVDVTRKAQKSGRVAGDVKETLFINYYKTAKENKATQATLYEMDVKARKQLARKVEKHFAFTDPVPYLLRENARVVGLHDQSVVFDALTPAQQAIVLDQLRAEGSADTLNDYTYTFTTFKASELPSTDWERTATTFIDHELGRDRSGHGNWGSPRHFPKHYNIIVGLEKAILKDGFSKDAPVLVGCLRPNEDTGRIGLNGGNHRVQAVRNLIKAGKLPEGFKIPAIATFTDLGGSQPWPKVDNRSRTRRRNGLTHRKRNETMESGLKRYQHDALMPLYKEHVFYLLRVLKTAAKQDLIDIGEFRKQIPKWRKAATCHEVAINEAGGLDLETHQNRLGKEREYTKHLAAKNVGRDLRVRIIWDLLAGVLDEDPALESVNPYPKKTIELGHEWTGVRCPFCDKIYYSDEWTKEIDGEHMDGTVDWHWEATGIDYNIKQCEHLIAGSDTDSWLDIDFEELIDRYLPDDVEHKKRAQNEVIHALESRGMLRREDGTRDDSYWFTNHSLKEIEDELKKITESREGNEARDNRRKRTNMGTIKYDPTKCEEQRNTIRKYFEGRGFEMDRYFNLKKTANNVTRRIVFQTTSFRIERMLRHDDGSIKWIHEGGGYYKDFELPATPGGLLKQKAKKKA